VTSPLTLSVLTTLHPCVLDIALYHDFKWRNMMWCIYLIFAAFNYCRIDICSDLVYDLQIQIKPFPFDIFGLHLLSVQYTKYF
jgi:hypothetical protein